MELDLDKQLFSHIIIWRVKLPLEYEGRDTLHCFRCGKYWFKHDQCRELLEDYEPHKIHGDAKESEKSTRGMTTSQTQG